MRPTGSICWLCLCQSLPLSSLVAANAFVCHKQYVRWTMRSSYRGQVQAVITRYVTKGCQVPLQKCPFPRVIWNHIKYRVPSASKILPPMTTQLVQPFLHSSPWAQHTDRYTQTMLHAMPTATGLLCALQCRWCGLEHCVTAAYGHNATMKPVTTKLEQELAATRQTWQRTNCIRDRTAETADRLCGVS